MSISPPRISEAATSKVRDIQIPALDGFALAATVYEPDAPTDKVVLITAGSAILRRYYDNLARFLQENGFGVVTFDYRGIGDSRPPSLKGFSARMHQWGQQDIAGVLRWIEQEMQPAMTFILGHFGFFRERFRDTLWRETVEWLKQH